MKFTIKELNEKAGKGITSEEVAYYNALEDVLILTDKIDNDMNISLRDNLKELKLRING